MKESVAMPITEVLNNLKEKGGELFLRSKEKILEFLPSNGSVDLHNDNEDKAKIEKQREDKARKTIDNIEMKLKKEAIGYYLFINYSKYGLSVNDYEKLADKYSKVLAMPSIDWTVVDTYGDNTSIYQKILSEMLNVSESSKLYTLKSKFESKILSDAEKVALDILKSDRQGIGEKQTIKKEKT